MTFDGTRYRHGYSIGAGAVVLCGAKILLLRLGYGAHQDHWAIPGGYVKLHETIDATIKREVLEETGVTAEVEGLIAVGSQCSQTRTACTWSSSSGQPKKMRGRMGSKSVKPGSLYPMKCKRCRMSRR